MGGIPVLSGVPLKSGDVILANYYDRNALTIYNLREVNQVAPATFVTQFTYTVPNGRKAMFDGGTVGTVRQIPATTQQDGSSRVFINNGTTNTSILLAANGANVPSAKAQSQLGGSIPMFAGYVLTGVSSDASTGGTMAFLIAATITEFDA